MKESRRPTLTVDTVGHLPAGGRSDRALGQGRGRRAAIAAIAIAIGLLTALLAFGLSRDPTRVRSSLEGRPAPDFILKTLDGSGTVRLADLRGQAVVVNFWASWCAECRLEKPAIAAAWDRYRDQRVVFLGISFQDTDTEAKAYATRNQVDWPLLADPGSRTGLAYGVSGVPETLFIDSTGRLVSKHIGPVSYTLLTDRIAKLLQGSSP